MGFEGLFTGGLNVLWCNIFRIAYIIEDKIKYYYEENPTMRVKVTRNYQITIPAEIRRKINLRLGEVVDVLYDEKTGEIRIKKISERRKTLKIGRKLTPEEIESLINRGMEDSL